MQLSKTPAGGDVIHLTRREWRGMFDAECRRRTGLSGREWLRRERERKHPDTAAHADLRVLAGPLLG